VGNNFGEDRPFADAPQAIPAGGAFDRRDQLGCQQLRAARGAAEADLFGRRRWRLLAPTSDEP
jgi:hypothetical protein